MPQARHWQMLVSLLATTAVLTATIAVAAAAAALGAGGGHRIGLGAGACAAGAAQQLGRLARRLPLERAGQDAHKAQSRGGTGRRAWRQIRYLGRKSAPLSSDKLQK